MSVTVVVLSYNRPRLIREALNSIHGADRVIIADDGSDLIDFPALLKDFAHLSPLLLSAPPLSIEERQNSRRLGDLLNKAMAMADHGFLGYLCDDDLFHPEWLTVAAAALRDSPDCIGVMGQWWEFEDGKKEVRLARGDWLNFLHRWPCRTRWPKMTIGADNIFLAVLRCEGPLRGLGQIAGYRRIHPAQLGWTVGMDDMTGERTQVALERGRE